MKPNYSIKHITPSVKLLHATPIFVGEVAGRRCYDSFYASEHEAIINYGLTNNLESNLDDLENIEESGLLEKLTHVYHHNSVVEHITLNFDVTDFNRGVLQQLVRSRIASYSARSTRYTMAELLLVFTYYRSRKTGISPFLSKAYRKSFSKWVIKNKVFTFDPIYELELLELNCSQLWEQLDMYVSKHGIDDLIGLVSKDSVEDFVNLDTLDDALKSLKRKKNIGDRFKHIVNDNWNTSIVMTFNMRSLKNFLQLRNSGAAYYLIKELAIEIEKAIPKGHLRLIRKITKDD